MTSGLGYPQGDLSFSRRPSRGLEAVQAERFEVVKLVLGVLILEQGLFGTFEVDDDVLVLEELLKD